MKKLFSLVILAGLLASCEPASRITGSWRKPKLNTSYNDVIIVGMTNNIDAKSTIENDLATALARKGIMVSKSMDIFPMNFTKDLGREEMMRRIKRTSSRAILTVSLIRKESSPHYVPGTVGYAPTYNYYGRFWGYYNYWYPTMYSPGYYTEDRVYYMETNVYDTETEELVWSAQSETYNPANMSGFSQELASIITDKLLKDNIIRPNAKLRQPGKDVTSRNGR